MAESSYECGMQQHNGGMVVVGGSAENAPIGVHLNEKANEYIRDCVSEKSRMDRKFPIAERLLDSEIEKVQITGRIPSRDQKYADIYREKPLRISQKVLVPIREHPKFNFVGKLLGPKGNSLRRLQEETLCKMTVLGRNSMRDRVKEEELRASKDPKYAHLNSELHVEISTLAPPAEAYARIAYAMAELRKYLIPDSNDVIRQEQLRELMDNTGISDNNECGGAGGTGAKNSSVFRKIPPSSTGNNVGGGGGGGGGVNAAKNSQAHGTYRNQLQQQNFNKNNVAPKQKVMSILEKARAAMEDTYGRTFDDHLSYEQPTYSYGHPHSTHTVTTQNIGLATSAVSTSIPGMTTTSRGPYDQGNFEQTDYNRRDYYHHSPSYGVSGTSNAAGGTTSNIGQPNQPQNVIAGGLNPNHNRAHVNR